MRKTILTTGQAAKLMGVSSTTVMKLTRTGELPFWTVPGASKHRRMLRSDVLALMVKSGMPIPAEG